MPSRLYSTLGSTWAYPRRPTLDFRWSIASRCSFHALSRIWSSRARSIRRISGRKWSSTTCETLRLASSRSSRASASLAVEQLLHALLRFCRDLVCFFVVLLAVGDEQLLNLFALLVLQVVDAQLGVEPPLGPFDQVFAQETLPLAASAASGEAIQ